MRGTETDTRKALTGEGLPPYLASPYQQDSVALGELAARAQRLALSENPYGPSPLATEAAAFELAGMNRYPDSSCSSLRETLAELHGVSSRQILVGNGIDELLLLIGQTFGGPGRVGLGGATTYFGHEATLRFFGTDTRLAPLGPDGLDLAEILARIDGCDLVLVCNPHNPTGTALTPDEVTTLVAAAAATDCVLVLDEAYAEFADPRCWSSGLGLLDEAAVVVLRTFSKAYGLAGLRCGYAIAEPDLIERLAVARHITPFSVNRVALAAARGAAEDQAHLQNVVAETTAARQTIAGAVDSIGRLDYQSQTNFLLIHTAADAEEAAVQLLERHAIHARPCRAIGFPEHLRVGASTAADAPAVAAGLLDVLTATRYADA